MLPMVESDAEIYNFINLFRMGDISIGGFERYNLISSKALWCSASHLKISSFFNLSSGEKGWDLPLRFEMNLL
jgi:hypothetical protein